MSDNLFLKTLHKVTTSLSTYRIQQVLQIRLHFVGDVFKYLLTILSASLYSDALTSWGLADSEVTSFFKII